MLKARRGRSRELLLSNQIPGELLENKCQFSKNSREGTSKYFYTPCHLLSASSHTIPALNVHILGHVRSQFMAQAGRTEDPALSQGLHLPCSKQVVPTEALLPQRRLLTIFYISVSPQIVCLYRKDFSIANVTSIFSITILKQITTTQNG